MLLLTQPPKLSLIYPGGKLESRTILYSVLDRRSKTPAVLGQNLLLDSKLSTGDRALPVLKYVTDSSNTFSRSIPTPHYISI